VTPSDETKDMLDLDLARLGSIDDEKKLFSILLEIMRVLRSKHGCAWDKEQDHESLKRSLLEEAYETIEAIDSKDPEELREELGDLLLQVVFHSQIASEQDDFDIKEVLRTISSKLIRRHPHVFGSKKAGSSVEVLANWEAIKKKERRSKSKDKEADSIFKNIPKILPALHFAYEIQERASRLGFDWDEIKDVFAKIKEEINETESVFKKGRKEEVASEIGDLLFSVVNFARHMDLDCEDLLKKSSTRFISRFDLMEKLAEEKGLDFRSLPLKRKDILWEEAKGKLDEKD